jgi:hypothetical protein
VLLCIVLYPGFGKGLVKDGKECDNSVCLDYHFVHFVLVHCGVLCVNVTGEWMKYPT